MKLSDFSDGYYGYCVTTYDGDKEVILSQCFKEGTKGVGDAMRKIVDQMRSIPTIGVRYSMLLMGIEMEAKHGMQLTSKTSASSAIVKKEFGMRNISKRKTGIAFGLLLNLAAMLYEEESK